jgi:hypothetical protein
MLEITAGHIAELADDDLRELIGLLCEAELVKRGLPVSAVTYGGDQRAGDGGLDVRVALTENAGAGDFVLRPNTGFQAKRQDMPRAAILKEMCPSGDVRAVIRELADASGAYVIACSQGSTSDSVLRNRRTAMKEAVATLPNAANLAVEFYDRTRLASWVRQHVGLVPWVRTKIGKALRAWQAYGPWAYEPAGTSSEFLVDDTPRMQTRQSNDDAGLSVAAGIERMRAILREPGSIVRLVGLSGVGKTRLVQALFDARVGAQPLDKAQALYTNMSDDPDPQPVGMVSDLLASRSRAVVVVDNCGSELHRRLSEVCRGQSSTLSVITIEYDIQDDEPEGTEVFELLPSSEGLVEQLIRRRFPQVSTVDVHTVAEFSGGNARIAIALAATAERGGSLSRLPERELFERLFQQRQGHDAGLLQAAQACALVYSFDVETLDGDSAELPRLAALAGTDAGSLHRSVAELLRRDLAQQRGPWRAVLPHAVANRLAAVALQDLPFTAIETQLINGAPERLLKSFSRRVGYLDSSPQATRIAQAWLEPDGLLGDTGNLNKLHRSMLMNIAPVVPQNTLAALERALASGPILWAKDAVDLLRSLAWDASLFERSVALLAKIANGETKTDADNALTELFWLCLSGTHAPTEQRIGVAEGYLRADTPALRRIGLLALGGLLKGWQFRSGFHYQFGGRSRDFGYWPRTGNELRRWFDAGFELARRAIVEGWPVASEVRPLVARRFRGLWTGAAVYDGLEAISRFITEHGYWSEGWVAIRETLRFDHASLSEESRERLIALERTLRPRDIVEKVRAVVFGGGLTLVDFEDFAPGEEERTESISGYQRMEEIAQELGEAVAVNETALNELLPGLVTGRGRFWAFGRGLALASEKPAALWKRLVGQLAITAQGERNIQVLGGFLAALNQRDPDLVYVLLDAALNDESLASWFVALQTSIPIDERGFDRLMRALEGGRTPIGAFGDLSGGRATDRIPAAKLRALVSAIAERDGGYDAAFEILFMRLHSDRDQHRPDDPELAAAGRALLAQLPFDHDDRDEDHNLRLVMKVALTGPEGAMTARRIWQNLVAAVCGHETHPYKQRGLLKALFATQPLVLLDELAGGDEDATEAIRLVEDAARFEANPIDDVPTETLLEWCRRAPAERFPLAAQLVTVVGGGENGGAAEWTSAARALLNEAPDLVAVLSNLVSRFRPTSWSGSMAAILSSRAELLQEFCDREDALAEYAKETYATLQRDITAEREWETKHSRERDERFE